MLSTKNIMKVNNIVKNNKQSPVMQLPVQQFENYAFENTVQVFSHPFTEVI